ncbi:Hypothetical protein A7982_02191 [Minicystis rosea]|nr:Hypothetical protein A7982_02191 [Minicystis rosea]
MPKLSIVTLPTSSASERDAPPSKSVTASLDSVSLVTENPLHDHA